MRFKRRRGDDHSDLPINSRESDASLTSQVVAGGVVAAATATLGPPGAVAAALMTPLVAELYERAASEWRSQNEQKAVLVLGAAAEDTDQSVEELLREIGSDEGKLLLLAETIEAAIHTREKRKLRALGRALASGALADDDAKVDDAQLRVNIIRELEAPHLRVLQEIAAASAHTFGDWRGANEADLQRTLVGDEGPRTSGVLQPVLRVLDRNGLIYLTGIGEPWDENLADDIRPDAGSNEWTITNFGRLLLDEFLSGHGTEDPS